MICILNGEKTHCDPLNRTPKNVAIATGQATELGIVAREKEYFGVNYVTLKISRKFLQVIRLFLRLEPI